jgi:excisionase family DNA binding protein
MQPLRVNRPGGLHDLQLLTFRDAAEICRCSQATVRRAVQNGRLEAIPLHTGRRGYRIRPTALRAWQDAGLPSGVVRNRCSSRLEGVDPIEKVDAA